MTLPFKPFQLLSLACIAMWLCACQGGTSSAGNMEGRIIYDVTFPFEKNTILMDLFPKEMTIQFKGDKMQGSIKSSYEILTSGFIVDNDGKTMSQMLKSMGDRYMVSMKEGDVNEWLKQYPEVRLEPTNETETIAGYVCNKTIARFLNDSLPHIELYHTKGLGLSTSNWWNQFNGIDGFLLGYDIEQYGKRMRLRAREVKFEKVNDEDFVPPTNYSKVDMAEMNHQLKTVVEQYGN